MLQAHDLKTPYHTVWDSRTSLCSEQPTFFCFCFFILHILQVSDLKAILREYSSWGRQLMMMMMMMMMIMMMMMMKYYFCEDKPKVNVSKVLCFTTWSCSAMLDFHLVQRCWVFTWSCDVGFSPGPAMLGFHLVLRCWVFTWSYDVGFSPGPAMMGFRLVLRCWVFTWSCDVGFSPGPMMLGFHLVLRCWVFTWSCDVGFSPSTTYIYIKLHLFYFLFILRIYPTPYLNIYQVHLLTANVSKIAGWMANSVDPDQTPRSAASDLGLHCLPRTGCPVS